MQSRFDYDDDHNNDNDDEYDNYDDDVGQHNAVEVIIIEYDHHEDCDDGHEDCDDNRYNDYDDDFEQFDDDDVYLGGCRPVLLLTGGFQSQTFSKGAC